MRPILQVALDFVDTSRAMKLAREAVAGGADWLEAGTPLIKAEGLNAIRALRDEFPRHTIVADMKIMDAGRAEIEMASKAGANVVVVLGVAADGTIEECIEAGRNFGVQVAVDLICVSGPVERARQVEAMGAAQVLYHIGIDQQMRAETPFAGLRALAEAVSIPVGVAGGINSETAAEAVEAGARILIVGGAITKSADAAAATRRLMEAITTGVRLPTELYRRAGEEDLREIFDQVSTPNISDGNHRQPPIRDLTPVAPDMKMVGTAFTVRSAPGDWAKPVQAIDAAAEGDILVISSGGVPPAVWGELATHSAMQRKLGGVMIDGGIRDTPVIRRLGFPAFARVICSDAGEPKGWGEIGGAVRIDGQRIEPGDWIVGDDDGIIVIPRRSAVEVANRAMDCLERENRIRGEIEAGNTTLGEVIELLKWEKK